ncbi:FXSXX-COOH protein [Streptomyces sp. HM190]|uniref:FXSXX-COOH protein n=1 Tax=Streptomyces sp. HM190 TaxID=2695266 RepID=UPI0013595E2E|nr:FXSXX-COOH protein [Streptomyces sp. HM190]
MDAPQNSHDSTRLVDISTVPTRRLMVVARKNTAWGHAVRRHLRERDGSVRTIDVVFESAL